MAANAAALSSVACQRFLSLKTYPTSQTNKRPQLSWRTPRGGAGSGRGSIIASVALEDTDVFPVRSGDAADQQEGLAAVGAQEEDVVGGNAQVGGFAFEGGATSFGDVGVSSMAGSSSPSPPPTGTQGDDGEDLNRMVDRAINATIVLAAGTAAITKLLTIDHDYWHGWTFYEILRYAPQHNWIAYEEALKTNPVLAKMMISGIVYSLGDWIAQCYEGKPLFEFDRARMFRSGLVGFTLHGSLSHYYYYFCEAGWKLWPFAHLITYGVIPVEQRLLWVDCVELIWVTILSTYSNEKSEARNNESTSETEVKSS